jgi:hypothetical protein
MTVVLVGVGADSGNVRPRPEIGPGRRFEYIPIPEKSRATAESRTFGSIPQRYGEGHSPTCCRGFDPTTGQTGSQTTTRYASGRSTTTRISKR